MNKQLYKNPNWIVLALLVIIGVCYSNHFNNTFHFDDFHTIVNNPYIKNIDNLSKFWYSPDMFSVLPTHRMLRPLVTASLAIDYWIAGSLDPFYFQLSTFIWFLFLTVILFFVYQHLLKPSVSQSALALTTIFTTAFFALHATHAETLNYIISRSDVLSTVFIVLAFFIFIQFKTSRKLYLYLIPALIGIMAKETAFTLLPILFLYLHFFENELSFADLFKSKHFSAVFKNIISLLPLAIVLVLLQLYFVSQVKHTTINDSLPNPWGYYVLTQSYVWLRYFILFFIPFNVSADSDWTVIKNIFDERIIIGIVFIIFLCIAIFKTSAKKETRPIAFGLLWFAIALLPTSLVPLAEVTNDHRMLFAFVGLTLAFGATVYHFLIKGKKNNRITLVISFVLVMLLVNSYEIFQRNKVWHTEEDLWLDVTQKSPGNGRGLMNYGLSLMRKGNYAEADTYFEKALVYNPYYDALYINIGILKGAIGLHEEADQNFKKAILYNKNLTDQPYYFYAKYLLSVNKTVEAEDAIQKAININPNNLESLYILCNLQNNAQKWDELNATCQKILSIQPNNTEAQKYLHAIQSKTVVSNTVKSNTLADYINTSLQYYNQKEFQKCINTCLAALKIDSTSAAAYNNLGAAYNSLRQWQKGYEACLKAVQLDPNSALAKGNLNWAKSELMKK